MPLPTSPNLGVCALLFFTVLSLVRPDKGKRALFFPMVRDLNHEDQTAAFEIIITYAGTRWIRDLTKLPKGVITQVMQ